MRNTTVRLIHTVPLASLIIRGFEGEGDRGDGASDGVPGSQGSDGDQSGGDASTDDDSADDGDDDDLPSDDAGLKSALAKERQNAKAAAKTAKALERENRRLKAAQEEVDNAKKGETEAAKAKADKAAEQVTKLAGKLRTQAIESAVTTAARAAGFRDADDVMAQLQRNNFAGIDVDQDEDDPSDIDIDEKSVVKAVKAIAAKKPHLLIANGDTSRSGSQFNGGSRNNGNQTPEQVLRDRYPALNGRI